ncbi:RNA polymerase I associated factor, A49-like protein, partial [Aduncisulcus paluster]
MFLATIANDAKEDTNKLSICIYVYYLHCFIHSKRKASKELIASEGRIKKGIKPWKQWPYDMFPSPSIIEFFSDNFCESGELTRSMATKGRIWLAASLLHLLDFSVPVDEAASLMCCKEVQARSYFTMLGCSGGKKMHLKVPLKFPTASASRGQRK